jgi:hypothetical protein
VAIFDGEGGFDPGRVVNPGQTQKRHAGLKVVPSEFLDRSRVARRETFRTHGQDTQTVRGESLVVNLNRFIVTRVDLAGLVVVGENAGASVEYPFESSLHKDENVRFPLS